MLLKRIAILTFLAFALFSLGCGTKYAQMASNRTVTEFATLLQEENFSDKQKHIMAATLCRDLGQQWVRGGAVNPERDNLKKIQVAAVIGGFDLNKYQCLHTAFMIYRMLEDVSFNPNSTRGGDMPGVAPVPREDIEKLIELGAELNQASDWGKQRTPLFYAAGTKVLWGEDQNHDYHRAASQDLYMMLVSMGARDDVRDTDGFTPKDIFMAVHYPPQAQDSSSGSNAQLLIDAIQMGSAAAQQERMRQYNENTAIIQQEQQYQAEYQQSTQRQKSYAEQAYDQQISNYQQAAVSTPPVATTGTTNSPAGNGCYIIVPSMTYKEGDSSRPAIGSAGYNYTVAGYKPVYCWIENHPKSLVTKRHLAVLKHDNSPICGDMSRGAFDSLKAAKEATVSQFPAMGVGNCHHFDKWSE